MCTPKLERMHNTLVLPPEVPMETWLFALVVLGVGGLLAYLLDRMRLFPKGKQRLGEFREKLLDRNRWLTYWFSGRFPTKEEEEELERDVEEAEEREREKRLEKRRKRPRS